MKIVICGSFRKDPEQLKREYNELSSLGYQILSPCSLDIVAEKNGFVYMDGESKETPKSIESKHLNAIEQAQLVWLHAPEGYVGLSSAFEIGFARAVGIPVFSLNKPTDTTLSQFVQVVPAMNEIPYEPHIPNSLKGLQSYYKRIAQERSYNTENIKECMLLMVEEVGELARAVRKQTKMVRYHDTKNTIEHEFADVLLYLIHFSNICEIDIVNSVEEKEKINNVRFQATKNI